MSTYSQLRKRSKEWGISDLLIDALEENGMQEYFPVQEAIIPTLLKSNSYACVQARDMCVSAPTGSGKTLSYAVPIIHILSMKQQSHHLKALIVLPSRELALQVYNVLAKLCVHTDLKVFSSVGQTDFSDEQKVLVGPIKKRKRSAISSDIFTNCIFYEDDSESCFSNVDILVCTPNRLLDHVHRTDGFSLKHLKFLVLDEADRLLGNAYNYWVKSLIDSTRADDNIRDSPRIIQRLLFSATLTDNPRKLGLLGIRNPLIVRIGSLSEELEQQTKEEKEEETNLATDQTHYTLPSTLTESIKICDAEDRPVDLISILMEAFMDHSGSLGEENSKYSFVKAPTVWRCHGNVCMIFASSVDSTHRLATLLKLFNGQSLDDSCKNAPTLKFGGRVEEISRMVNARSRLSTLEDAENGLVKVIVASDNMARGIDLANVKLVINYDPPKFLKTYVHRAGRTARANRLGHCVTLLKKGQVVAFKRMRSAIGDWSEDELKIKPPRYKIDKHVKDEVVPHYQRALIALQQVLATEEE